MKVGSDSYINIHPQDIEDIPTGKKKGGVCIEIEGALVSHAASTTVKLWLSRNECKELRKLIREAE